MPDLDPHVPVGTALFALNRAILRALASVHEDGWCLNLRALERRTSIPREVCRAILRGLTDAGLTEYCRGLWDCDGEPAGSGYCITDAGRDTLPPEPVDDDLFSTIPAPDPDDERWLRHA